MKKVVTFCAIVMFNLGLFQSGFSQVAGTYDPSFAVNGELTDSIINPFLFSSMALVPGNEFVISRIGHDSLIVVRYLVSGERDVTFGPFSTGVNIINLSWTGAAVTSSAVQSDRKTIIAGRTATSSASSKGFLLRLNDDGSIDNTFGTNGYVYTQLYPNSGDQISQVTIQPDGNILVMDVALNTDSTDSISLLRYTVSGSLDNTFNGTGVYGVPFYNFLPTGPFYFNIDGSNNVNFGAYSNYADTDNIFLFQLNPNGTLNTSYGQQGPLVPAGETLITQPGLIDHGYNIGLNFDANDKLLLTQSSLIDSIQWIIARFNTDGTPDVSFGDSGVVDMQGADGALPFSIQNITPTPFNQIVVAGLVSLAGSTRIDVARLNSNGTLDAAFGDYSGQTLLNALELDDFIWNVIVQPDEKILINGLVAEKKIGAAPPYILNDVVRLIGSGNGSTGVNEIGVNAQMEIYPNPTGSSFYVTLSGASEGTFQLTDLEGRLVQKQTLQPASAQQFNIENLSAGVYLLTFRNDDAVISRKVVKQ